MPARALRKLLLLRGGVIGVRDYPATHFNNSEPAVSVRSEKASKSIRDGVRTWRSILKFWGAKAVLISSYCCKKYCYASSSALYEQTEPVSVPPSQVGTVTCLESLSPGPSEISPV